MALTLHAFWLGQRLWLWTDAPAAPNGNGGDDAVAALRAAIGELSPDGLLAESAAADHVQLWLPVDERGVPVTCPTAIAPVAPGNPEEPGNGDVATLLVTQLLPVTVPALSLSPLQAVDLLTSLPDPAPTENCGDSIRYWAALTRLVLDLLAHRQFIPNLEETSAGFFARWRPVVQDRDQLDWLERLAVEMPAACRAAVHATEKDRDPSAIVESFLGATADALIRRCVADDPFFRQPAERLSHADRDMRPPETRWVAALLNATDPRVAGSDGENGQVAQAVHSWVSQIEPAAAASSMRLVFELHEPDEPQEEDDGNPEAEHADDEPVVAAPDGPWRLKLLLASEAGPDEEVIPAADLWEGGNAAVLLGRGMKNRQARLLNELQRASEIFPLLQPLTQHVAPSQVDLQTADAYAFIRQWSTVLRDQGFGIRLPGWADRAESELGLRLQVRPLEEWPTGATDDDDGDAPGGAARAPNGSQPIELPSGHFGLDALLQFDWHIAVGNLRISTKEFERLAAQNVPLVKLRGQWVQIDLEAARQAAEFLQKQQDKPLTLAEALRTAYGSSRTETGLPVLGMGGTSWIEQLLEQLPGAKMEERGQPASFKGSLRPYQVKGLQWLAFLDRLGIGACLADDMGLGKTIQLIALLLQEREILAASQTNGHPLPSLGPTLLFAPTSVVGNWVRELERFAPEIKVLVHHGPERLAGETFAEKARQADLVLTSYALAHRDREDLQRVSWRRVALDEAQKIKNPAAASTAAIRGLTAARRVALTGTPIENHLSELWSIMEVLNPGLLGPAGEFRERFAVPIEKMGDRDRGEQLRRLIRPFILRRLKSDPEIAGDLPEKMEAKVFCNLTPEQAAQYERLVGQSLSQIDAATGIRRRGLILSVLTRLKQICDHPSLVLKDDGPIEGRSGKCERLVEMLEELLEEGDAALVFTQFREMGHLLERLIAQRLNAKTLFLHGGTPSRDRDSMVETFQSTDPEKPRVFILSLRAGGLGLNLTAANHVFHFDRWWNPAVESQATDRAHRVGQTRKVQVHKFVCIGTMEERIDRLLTEKLALADKIIGSGDEWLTGLSTDQLREYLSLSREAVGEF